MNFAGFAVTKPNKIEVLKYLDELDPLCEKMGSSNTVVKTPEGKLIDYNTDGTGFIRSLNEYFEKEGTSVSGKRYFCIGSCGAGRAICSSLAYCGAEKIYITDISEAGGRSLEADINRNFPPVAEFVSGNMEKIIETCLL